MSGGEQAGKRTRKVYSAREKAEAVLSVWCARRTVGRVCRELGAHGNVLAGWEKRALSGMLEALGARPVPERVQPLELGRRLEKLLEEPPERKAGQAAEPKSMG